MQRGTVAAGDPRTVAAGVELLRAGGTAVDAAVAAVFAACVAEPPLTSVFGGGFVSFAGRDGAATLEAFAQVPGRGLGPAREQAGLDFHGIDVDFGATTQAFHIGRGSVAVPRLLPGLLHLHREAGRCALSQVIAPAVKLAREGVRMSAAVAHILRLLEPILVHDPEVAALFAPGGRLLSEGERFVSPDLADMLEHLGAGGAAAVQERLLEAFGAPAGRLTRQDLVASEIAFSPPLEVMVGPGRVSLPPPPSAGGALVGFGLRLLEGSGRGVWQDETQAWAHLAAAMAVTSAARGERVRAGGHPDASMLEDGFVDRWREPFARAVREGWPGGSSEPDDLLGSTTHVSVVDAEGRMCAVTSSNGEGCGHLVPGCGVMANNFLGEEDLHPEGFHRQMAGSTIRSMMTPTLVLDAEGRPAAALGSGGSNRIRTVLLQTLARHLLGGVPLGEAVLGARLHFEDDGISFEQQGPDGRGMDRAAGHLAALGYELVTFERPSMYFGGVHAVSAAGEGIGDPRRGGAAGRA